MKRWWGIRHLRYFYLSWSFWHWWEETGYLLGAFPNPRDLEYLDAIWRGEA